VDQKSLGWATLIRLGIAVEGDTEIEFVKKLLAVRLRDHDVEATPVSLDGGMNLARLANEMVNLHGPLVGQDIGLAAIRAECPNFDGWIRRLCQLGNPSASSP